MVPNERKLTFASYVIPSRRCILEAECRRRCLAAGRDAGEADGAREMVLRGLVHGRYVPGRGCAFGGYPGV